MPNYILYCGPTSIAIGGEPGQCPEGRTEIEYSENLIACCLGMVVKGRYYIPGNGDALLEKMKAQFKYIEAAGGYVISETGQSLVIIRNGLYDLPKGKVEPGENVEDAALREVSEETGLQSPSIKRKLLDTYHFYRWGSNPEIILKKTHWYLMGCEPAPSLKPQAEEGITECLWVSDSKINEMQGSTHRNLRILFQLKKDGQI